MHKKLNMVQAINASLRHAMQQDNNIILMGQDIGKNGGVFRATDGLWAEFGGKRVIDMPISEALMSGMATGMAMAGLTPVVEFQFSGFMLSAVEQLMTHSGRVRSRTQGRLNCPMVIRAPYGSGIGAPEHHSESPEALFAHIPGIKVAVPASPQEAHGLLLSAIAEPDPVVILEPKKLYHANPEEVEIGRSIALDRSYIVEEGYDITLIGWGAMVPLLKEAADICHDISCEIINLSSIYPYDKKQICQSLRKTGKVIVVHEACLSFGVAAEIIATISEYCTSYLLAPPQRITGYDIPTPYFRREKQFRPSVKSICNTIYQLMEYQYA